MDDDIWETRIETEMWTCLTLSPLSSEQMHAILRRLARRVDDMPTVDIRPADDDWPGEEIRDE